MISFFKKNKPTIVVADPKNSCEWSPDPAKMPLEEEGLMDNPFTKEYFDKMEAFAKEKGFMTSDEISKVPGLNVTSWKALGLKDPK